MLNPKIADHHLMRKACIYIRQSTMAQVQFNQESTERQYNLADQAKPSPKSCAMGRRGQCEAVESDRRDQQACSRSPPIRGLKHLWLNG